MEYNYNSNVSLSAGFNYMFTGYQHVTTHLFGENKDIVEFLDRQTWVTVPLSIKFGDDEGTFRPYAYAGYSLNFLLRDRGILTVTNRDSRPATVEGEAEGLWRTAVQTLASSAVTGSIRTRSSR